MKRLKEQVEALGKTSKVYYNDIRHQRKGSECGMYCLYFIISLLEGRRFKEVISHIMPDDKVNVKRWEYFSTPIRND